MHLEDAQDERAYYQDLIDAAKKTDDVCHLTFDFAQQLELPFHTRQVGPLYFKVRFRVQLFGICEEAKKRQTYYVYHEGECIGEDGGKAHGPNSVISMLDHHLEVNCPGYRSITLHADNCVAQNKNKSVIAYLVWHVMCGLADAIELNFMRVGHTRCSVDAYFGLLKQNYRSHDVDTMDHVVDVTNTSCTANTAVRFEWQWRNWDSHLSQFFQPIKGIRKFQHFRVSAEDPGKVFVRAEPMGEETKICLLKPGVAATSVAATRPDVIEPADISAKWVSYLDKQVSEFITKDCTPPWQAAE